MFMSLLCVFVDWSGRGRTKIDESLLDKRGAMDSIINISPTYHSGLQLRPLIDGLALAPIKSGKCDLCLSENHRISAPLNLQNFSFIYVEANIDQLYNHYDISHLLLRKMLLTTKVASDVSVHACQGLGGGVNLYVSPFTLP